MAKNKEKAGAGKTIVILLCGFAAASYSRSLWIWRALLFQSFSSRLYGKWL